MSNIQRILGNNIRKLRNKKGWSQTFLADRLDISTSFVTLVESGQRGMSLSLVEDIASLFDIPIPYLFTDHEDSEKSENISEIYLTELEDELKADLTAHLESFFEKKRRP